MRAALDHLDIPPTDPAVRARLEAEATADPDGPSHLRSRLAQLDPVAAQRIEPNNIRRIVRALEVIELTGQPFSATMPERRHLRPTVMIGLTLDRASLDARIEARTRGMWDAGLVAEVEHLLDRASPRAAPLAPHWVTPRRSTNCAARSPRRKPLKRPPPPPGGRAAAGVLVPTRPAHHLVAGRGTRPARARPQEAVKAASQTSAMPENG